MNRRMKTSLLTGMVVLFGLLHAGTVHGQIPAHNSATDTMAVIFRFLPGQDMFYIPWAGNGLQLEKLYAFLDEYRSEITAGRMPVYVDGYCASLPTARENLTTAFVRANRVKSELILRKGLKETNFVTANYAHSYHNSRDVVIVTLRIPATEKPKQSAPVMEQPEPEEPLMEIVSTSGQAVEKEPETQSGQVAEIVPEPVVPVKTYRFAVRTNVLYDAFLLPTLGIEWRINRDFGIKLDGSLSCWSGEHGKVQKMWLLNPEVRWYLLRDRRFYVGASGTCSEYNIYKYPLGNMLKDDIGYQGKLWNAGLTVGYQLCLSRSFSVDFNLGLGYTRSEYDSFTMADNVRVYQGRDKSKNFWGPTQAGISLIWTIGRNK